VLGLMLYFFDESGACEHNILTRLVTGEVDEQSLVGDLRQVLTGSKNDQ